MSRKIFFARTRYEYGSYIYFWRLVELSGIPVCYVDQIDLESDDIYIVTPVNGEFRPHMEYRTSLLKGAPRRCRTIWWNLERPGDESTTDQTLTVPAWRASLDSFALLFDSFWACDRHISLFDSRMIHVLVGGDARMMEGAPVRPYTYDFCHFSYVNGRRDQIYAGLVHRGLKMAPPDWAASRQLAWNSSKVLVNVHQNAVLGGEQIRFAMAAAYSVPLISEALADPYPLVQGVDFLGADYGNLVERAYQAITGPQEQLDEIAKNLREKLTGYYNFKDCVLRGVAESLKKWGE